MYFFPFFFALKIMHSCMRIIILYFCLISSCFFLYAGRRDELLGRLHTSSTMIFFVFEGPFALMYLYWLGFYYMLLSRGYYACIILVCYAPKGLLL
jgi:hypothetical protein